MNHEPNSGLKLDQVCGRVKYKRSLELLTIKVFRNLFTYLLIN